MPVLQKSAHMLHTSVAENAHVFYAFVAENVHVLYACVPENTHMQYACVDAAAELRGCVWGGSKSWSCI